MYNIDLTEYDSMVRYGIYTKPIIAKLWQSLNPSPPLDAMVSLMNQLDMLVLDEANDRIIIPCMIQLSSATDAEQFRIYGNDTKRVWLMMDVFPMYAFYRLMVQVTKQPGFTRSTLGKDALCIEYHSERIEATFALDDSTGGTDVVVVVVRSPQLSFVNYNDRLCRPTVIQIETSNNTGWSDAVEAIRNTLLEHFQQVSSVVPVVLCQCEACASAPQNNKPQSVFDLVHHSNQTRRVRCPMTRQEVRVTAIAPVDAPLDGSLVRSTSVPLLMARSINSPIGTPLPSELQSRCTSIDDRFFWQYGYDLAPSQDTVAMLRLRFDTVFFGLRNVLKAELAHVRDDYDIPAELVFELTATTADSTSSSGTKTCIIDYSELEVMVPLNASDGSAVAYDGSSIMFRDTFELNDLIVHELFEAFRRALQQIRVADKFDIVPSPTKALAKFKSKSMPHVEFDVLPVIRTVDGSYLVLHIDGSVTMSANESAADEIERTSAVYHGVREIVRCLKKVGKAHWSDTHDETLKLSPCMFESAAIAVAASMTPSTWNSSAFITLWQACLAFIIDRCRNGLPIAPPSNQTADVLTNAIRSNQDLLVFLEALRVMDETCLKRVLLRLLPIST
jgi:hypothetical protein